MIALCSAVLVYGPLLMLPTISAVGRLHLPTRVLEEHHEHCMWKQVRPLSKTVGVPMC